MNFLEQELRKFFSKDHAFDDVKFIGKACYGTLGEKTRMKLEFVTLGTYQKYEGIKATVIDKNDDNRIWKANNLVDAIKKYYNDEM